MSLQTRITALAQAVGADIKVLLNGKANKSTTLSGYGITDAAPSTHVGATGTAHGLATTSTAGFLPAADKRLIDISSRNNLFIDEVVEEYVDLGSMTVFQNTYVPSLLYAVGNGRYDPALFQSRLASMHVFLDNQLQTYGTHYVFAEDQGSMEPFGISFITPPPITSKVRLIYYP